MIGATHGEPVKWGTKGSYAENSKIKIEKLPFFDKKLSIRIMGTQAPAVYLSKELIRVTYIFKSRCLLGTLLGSAKGRLIRKSQDIKVLRIRMLCPTGYSD